ncbi:hypothetical protein [Embleya sp. MST-111070]|uniref:hypothetical protein n=1 Tax=Embleya sp. MST-111070 TaxID=3398231 RepID=UPI003F7327FC
MGPPTLRKYRSLLSGAFTPQLTEVMESQVVEITHGLLDRLDDTSEIELASAFAYPLRDRKAGRLADRRVRPREDLLTGHITTTMTLGNTVLRPDADPEKFARVRADRSLVGRFGAVEHVVERPASGPGRSPAAWRSARSAVQPWAERQARASGVSSLRPLNRNPKSQAAQGLTAPVLDGSRSG